MIKFSRSKLPQFRLDQLFLLAALASIIAGALSALVRTEPEQGYISIALSPDGKLLAASGNDCVQIFDLESREIIASYSATNAAIYSSQTIAFFDNDTVCSVSDGRSIAAATPGIFWFSVRQKKVTHFQPLIRFDQTAAIAGDQIVIRTRSKATITNRSLNPDSGENANSTLKFIGDSVFLNSDGSEFAVYAMPYTIKNPITHIHDSQSGKLLDTVPGSHEEFQISPDNKKFLISNSQGLQLLDRATHQPIWENKVTDSVRGLRFSCDGKWIHASPHYGNTEILDAATGKVKFEIPNHPYFTTTAAFSIDGKRVYTADNGIDSNIKVWDLDSGLELATISAVSNKTMQMLYFSFGLTAWSVIWVWRRNRYLKDGSSDSERYLYLRCAACLLAVGGCLGTYGSLKTLSAFVSQTGMFGRMPATLQVMTIAICVTVILGFVVILINGLTSNQKWLKSQFLFLIGFDLLRPASFVSVIGIIGIVLLFSGGAFRKLEKACQHRE